MPKRLPTPPPTDDSHFFTVVNPYPNQPCVSLDDSKAFARWIACVVGEDNLLAFYHKPKSPNVVIIEVTKDNFDIRRLLGGHRWDEILKHPRKHEVNHVSCIYPCTMTTSWSIEKVRWMRCDVQSPWFGNWSPEEDNTIAYPYPYSHYCKPPAEDITRSSLCRPLREDLFCENGKGATQRPVAFAPRQPGSSAGVSYCNLSTTSDILSDLSSDDFPTAHELSLSSPSASPPFIPAIHGVDTPKNCSIVVNNHPAAVEGEDGASLWPDYDEEAAMDKAQASLCTAHGSLCRRGICRLCAARKRSELQDERARRRQEERTAFVLRRGGGQGREAGANTGRYRPPHLVDSSSARSRSCSTSSSSSNSSGSLSSGSGNWRTRDATTKGKLGRDAPDLHPHTRRTLPAHLRLGARASQLSLNAAPTHTPASSQYPSTTEYPALSPASESSLASSNGDDDASSVVSRGTQWPWLNVPKCQGDDDHDGESVVTSGTWGNPWKRERKVQAAPVLWADIFEEERAGWTECAPRAGVRVGLTHGDDMTSLCDFDEEPF